MMTSGVSTCFIFPVQTLMALGMIFTCCCCLCCCCFCCGKCAGSENEEHFQYMDPDELEAEMSEEQNRGEEATANIRLPDSACACNCY